MNDHSVRLWEISGQLLNLQTYIANIPISRPKNEIDKANTEWPNGRTYHDIVQDLETLLPETIDKHLENASQYANAYSNEYAAEIRSKCAAILQNLKNFRASFVTTPSVTTPSTNMYFVPEL